MVMHRTGSYHRLVGSRTNIWSSQDPQPRTLVTPRKSVAGEPDCKFPPGLVSKHILQGAGWCRLVHIWKKKPGFLVQCRCQAATLECKHGKSNIWRSGFFAQSRTAVRSLLPAPHTHAAHKSHNNLPIPEQPQCNPSLPVSQSYSNP